MPSPDEPEPVADADAELADRLEPAPSGRAGCRACGAKIAKGEWRFGEVLPSSFGEGEGTAAFWFHLRCAAQRRPDKFARLLRDNADAQALPDRERLQADAAEGVAFPKLARVAGAERASSGRARCRQCQRLIPDGGWRLRLSSFGDTGFFDPLGFIHAGCARAYLETDAPLAGRLRLATPELDDGALAEIAALVAAGTPPPEPPA